MLYDNFLSLIGQMVYEGSELNHAFGLCHYKHFLFWNEYRGGSIFKLDTTTSTVTLLRNERPPLFEIRVYDAHQQQGNFNGKYYMDNAR
jgi:integrin beta 2